MSGSTHCHPSPPCRRQMATTPRRRLSARRQGSAWHECMAVETQVEMQVEMRVEVRVEMQSSERNPGNCFTSKKQDLLCSLPGSADYCWELYSTMVPNDTSTSRHLSLLLLTCIMPCHCFSSSFFSCFVSFLACVSHSPAFWNIIPMTRNVDLDDRMK